MFNITTSKNCAWRAAYFYKDNNQVGHLGIDPNFGYGKPRLFGGIGNKVFNIELPYLKWKVNSGTVRNWIYKKQNRFWLNLDGRK